MGLLRNRDPVLDARVRPQLERILASEIFTRSERLSSFLRFVVERTLEGQDDRLSEKVLGSEFYGKGSDFDGSADPIVRVEARRLRDKLREYYTDHPKDPIRITLPKGGYVPAFVDESCSTEATGRAADDPPGDDPLKVSRPIRWRWLAPCILLAVALGAALPWSLSRRTVKFVYKPVLLSTFPSRGLGPALSPDGRSIAFSGNGPEQTGPADIWIKDLNNGKLRRLTHTPETGESLPSWSPDGRQIAFVRRGHGVFLVPLPDGPERQVAGPSANYVTWSPDGKSVLVRDREQEGPFGICQVFIDSQERRQLTQPHLGDGDWRFSVSPDGTSLAFTRFEHPGSSDVYIVSMRGGDPRRVTNWGGGPNSVVWTSDGKELIYSMEERGLWRVSASLSEPARGDPIPGASMAASNLSISAPGPRQAARLAVQTYTREISFRVIDLTAPLHAGVFQDVMPFATSTRQDAPGPFTPDSRRFAFVSVQPAGIWTSQIDGTDLRRITELKVPPSLGSWSPDARSMVYAATVDGNTDVFVVDAMSGGSKRLTYETSIDGAASWSRDGRWIYFASTRSGASPDIWRMLAEGGAPVRVTQHGGFEARESRDGYLYYLDRPVPEDRAFGTARLMRMPVDGGPETVVLGGLTPLQWSMTDSDIFYITREREFDAINRYRLNDGRVSHVGRLAVRVGPFGGHMTVSPDGRWALVPLQQGHPDIMMIDNFR